MFNESGKPQLVTNNKDGIVETFSYGKNGNLISKGETTPLDDGSAKTITTYYGSDGKTATTENLGSVSNEGIVTNLSIKGGKPVSQRTLTVYEDGTATNVFNKLDEAGAIVPGQSSTYNYGFDCQKMTSFTRSTDLQNGVVKGELKYSPEGKLIEVIQTLKDGTTKVIKK